MGLRDYQSEGIDKILHAFESFSKVLYQLPTGGGKTVIAAEIIRQYLSEGKTVWFVVHRKDLVKQTSKRLCSEGFDHSFITDNGKYQPWKKLHLVMVQTFHRRHQKITEVPDLVIIDEAHHAKSEQYRCLPFTKWLGLTATPYRLGGDGLFDVFEHIIIGPVVTGHLVDFCRSICKRLQPCPRFIPLPLEVD